jgi:hypothetical protein
MDPLHRAQLRIVRSETVRPHEIADATREQRIEQRLSADGTLRDPVMVGTVSSVDGYVLLDGTNRQQALQHLGLPSILVQVLDYADHHVVQLQTWCHLARLPIGDLVQEARTIHGIDVEALSPLEAVDALHGSASLAVLLARGQRYALIRRANPTVSRAQQLRRLVDVYERGMVRVDCEPDAIEERAHALSDQGDCPTLVAFPPFTRSQVVTMAMEGALIPAGITHHVVLGGRALRVNVPLSMLAGDDSLDDANATLKQHLATLQPRQYLEPTILFDS